MNDVGAWFQAVPLQAFINLYMKDNYFNEAITLLLHNKGRD